MPSLLDAARVAKPGPEPGPNQTQRTFRILIVDDEMIVGTAHARVVDRLNKIFEKQGLNLHLDIKLIVGGPNAIKTIGESEPFDLIITDYHMPNANGLVVLRAAKVKDAATKVLIFSGFISEFESSRAKFDGAEDILIKPVPTEVIHARVKTALGIRDPETSTTTK